MKESKKIVILQQLRIQHYGIQEERRGVKQKMTRQIRATKSLKP
jgi:hypothetical protein